MLLDDKTAVIYGAGGSIGGAVARAFAREGAARGHGREPRPRRKTLRTFVRCGKHSLDLMR